MPSAVLIPHEGLSEGSRLRRLTAPGERITEREVAFLLACGLLATIASTYVDISAVLGFKLRLPGHAILRSVFPMVLGLAVVPRRGSGTVMGASALLTGLGLRAFFPTGGLSLGALTSLALTGPMLDLSLRSARSGWRLYVGFALAGLTANLVAFLVRGGTKLLGFEHFGARPLSDWLMHAGFSYVACGLAAGLISGAVWFRASRPRDRSEESTE